MSSPVWFVVQLALALAAAGAAPLIARGPAAVWRTVAAVSFVLLLGWPLLRVFPVQTISLLGPEIVAHTEFTGLAVPAALFFGIVARHVPRPGDARAIYAVLVLAGVYFVKAGWWMVGPGVPDLGPGKRSAIDPTLCMQTTDYTCVPASMVTLLTRRGVEATETEMARLAMTEVGSGTTDSRAILALRRKLAGTGMLVTYRQLTAQELISAPKPCLVQLDWGYFISHMVPVLEATAERVTIGDPLAGTRSMFMADFVKQWKGQAIVVEGP